MSMLTGFLNEGFKPRLDYIVRNIVKKCVRVRRVNTFSARVVGDPIRGQNGLEISQLPRISFCSTLAIREGKE
jgi:hypothetical protein